MGRPARPERTYTPQEKQHALQQLVMNGGNLQRTSRETRIPVTTLYRWREAGFAEFISAQSEEMDQFLKTIMQNIKELNKPGYIKKLKAKILESGKGGLKEIAQYTSILAKEMMALKRAQALTSGGIETKKSMEELSDEELKKRIREEEAKENEQDS